MENSITYVMNPEIPWIISGSRVEKTASLGSQKSQINGRSDSSDSGSESIGGTIYSKEFSGAKKSSQGSLTVGKSPKSPVAANNRQDTETWPDLSIACIDYDDATLFNKEAVQADMYTNIFEDLLDHERSAARDFRLVCECLPRLIAPFLESSGVVVQLSKKLKDLKDAQSTFLEDISSMENPSQLAQRVLCMTHNILPILTSLLEQYPIYIAALDQLAKSNQEFRAAMTNLEESSQCYIPLNWILLKILHRIIAWRPILTRMVEWQLSEGVNDTDIGPRLLRFGWVLRWSQRGLSPRMLLLFSDAVLLAHRSTDTPFAISVELKLKGLLVEDGDSFNVTGQRDDVFTLHMGKKSVILLSPAKDDWVKDISTAVKEDVRNRLDLPPIQIDNHERNSTMENGEPLDDAQAKDRPKKLTPLQIVEVSQSGYLLRKLRNSNGWQKLWTELTSHTLFFYKTHQDDVPLANLPLLEYKLCMPSVTDHGRKPSEKQPSHKQCRISSLLFH
ncbi:hypothetical protein NECAME_08501 [Necator americanus]|uniref:PH domain-containing protein n=1 Tax=Necator americanus TaxID=51031 RepID=W2TKA2_NECAM|nr:hypothetical protein NECAME_08501 [Necator americanus]ETN81427.1 hypothetical protein NECAME_08501 [Necator americanus]